MALFRILRRFWPLVLLFLILVLSIQPARLAWLHRQTIDAFSRGDPESAAVLLRQSLEIAPHDWRSLLLLARAARRQGHSTVVATLLDQARMLGAPDDRIERERLLVLAQSGKMELVEPAITRLLTRDADDANEVCAALVAGYAHNFEFAQASSYLDAWQQDYPFDPEPHIMRGRIRKRFYDAKNAEREFRAALRLRPDYLGLRELLAEVLVQGNRFEEACDLLEAGLRERPRDERLQIAWADCLLRTGRSAEADTLFRRLAGTHPDNCDVLFGLGRLALWSGDTQEALRHLERVRERCPDRADARYVYSQALSQAGRTEEAAREAEFVQRANAAGMRIFDLSEALVANPADVASRREIGESLLRYGDPAEGTAWLETVFRFEPEDPVAHRLLAEYYESIGDSESANRHKRLDNGRGQAP